MHKQRASGTDFVLAASCFKWALFHHWTTVAMGGATFLLALAHSVQQCFLSPDSPKNDLQTQNLGNSPSVFYQKGILFYRVQISK